MELNEAVHSLAVARRRVAAAKEAVAKQQAYLEMTAQYKAVQQAREEAEVLSRTEDSLYQAVRDLGVTIYEDTGEKHPHPAVEIGLYDHLDYDPDVAFEHCRLHLLNAIKLNKVKFEKVAKAAEFDFVTISKVPRASVSTDLSEYSE